MKKKENRESFFKNKGGRPRKNDRELVNNNLRRTSVYFTQEDWDRYYTPFQEKNAQGFSEWVREKLKQEMER